MFYEFLKYCQRSRIDGLLKSVKEKEGQLISYKTS